MQKVSLTTFLHPPKELREKLFSAEILFTTPGVLSARTEQFLKRDLLQLSPSPKAAIKSSVLKQSQDVANFHLIPSFMNFSPGLRKFSHTSP